MVKVVFRRTRRVTAANQFRIVLFRQEIVANLVERNGYAQMNIDGNSTVYARATQTTGPVTMIGM